MAVKKAPKRYCCIECGYVSLVPMGKCPQCHSFGTLVEETPVEEAPVEEAPVEEAPVEEAPAEEEEGEAFPLPTLSPERICLSLRSRAANPQGLFS